MINTNFCNYNCFLAFQFIITSLDLILFFCPPLKNLGFKDIKTTELAYVFTKRDENSFAKYAETLIANFALSKGVEKEKVSEWQRQIKKAEENGRFCFTSIPVLTEAILEK